MRKPSFVPILTICFCSYWLVGCSEDKSNRLPSSAKSILEKADKIELISLDPGNPERDERPPKGDYFGWKELGRTTIDDPEILRNVVSTVEKGFEVGGRAAACFWPRHALHVSHKGKTVDILICFHCSQVAVYVDGKQVDPYLTISLSPQPVLDKLLIDAKVPLAPKPENESSGDYK
jgi:hypothetical protein